MTLASSTADQAELERVWLARLQATTPVAPASEVYGGRAFFLARESAELIRAELAIVSAGLGWVRSTKAIPSYDLTSVRGGLTARTGDGFKPATWWRAVVAGPYSTDPASDLDGRVAVLACVSREYVSFFVRELDRVPSERLRIFGAGLERHLPTEMRRSLLPYDDRLAELSAGTRADFAQRALRHYVEHIGVGGDLEADRAAVETAMAALPCALPPPKREQMSDDGLRGLIQTLLPVVGMRRSPMLRHLRDIRGVACEQGRFARLFREATAE